MADESEEDTVETEGGLSEVDDEALPEEMPRPEKSADDPDLVPEDPDEEALPEEIEDLEPDDPDDGEGDGTDPGDGDAADDSSGGLTKVDPEDRDKDPEEMRSHHRPDTTGPDSAGEMAPPDPGEDPPFDPVDTPDVGPVSGADSGADDDGPPPGHAAGATRPGELFDDDGGGGEVEAEVEPEVEPEAGPEVESGASTGTGDDVGMTEADLGDPPEGAPIAEPDYDVPEVGSAWDTKAEEPPDDEEMPLTEHVEEMVRRFAVVLLTIAVGTAISFIVAEFVLLAMWNGLVPGDSVPHVYGPLEKILTEVKVASLGGILVALPVFVYETYLFMRPGLYPKERRYYLAAVPTSLVLGGIGMLFSYFLVLPVLFEYFVYYSDDGVDRLAFGLQTTFDLIVTMLWAFAIVFQIPLLMMLAIMMGITTREWLESKRIYFWGGFLGLGFFMGGVDPTSVAGIIIAATMIGLFEGTLAVLRWVQGDLPWRDRGASS